MLTPHGDPLGRIGDPDIGGQCVYVRELSRFLGSAGHDVRIYTRYRNDDRPREESFTRGVTVVRIPCGPSGFVPKEELLPHLPEFTESVRRDLGDGVTLHSHYWDGGHVAQALQQGNAWFHTTHSIGKLKQAALPDGEGYRYEERIGIETQIYNGCDAVIALTDRERDQIRDLYGVPEDRIAVIPPGVDPEVYLPQTDKAALRTALGLPRDDTLVFTLGRLDERKGFDLYLEAAARVLAEGDQKKITFVLSAGASSQGELQEQEKLEAIARRHNLGDALHWLPVLSEAVVPQYYAACDIFVMPSRYEPFGIVMLEAMSAELPVVATIHGGPTKVIEDGVDGMLVDPCDVGALADGIQKLVTSPEMRKALGANARRKVLSDYSWSSIAARHLEAFGVNGDHRAR
jgi:glycosyltransferase involved in cell wall biosynthesis